MSFLDVVDHPYCPWFWNYGKILIILITLISYFLFGRYPWDTYTLSWIIPGATLNQDLIFLNILPPIEPTTTIWWGLSHYFVAEVYQLRACFLFLIAAMYSFWCYYPINVIRLLYFLEIIKYRYYNKDLFSNLCLCNWKTMFTSENITHKIEFIILFKTKHTYFWSSRDDNQERDSGFTIAISLAREFCWTFEDGTLLIGGGGGKTAGLIWKETRLLK